MKNTIISATIAIMIAMIFTVAAAAQGTVVVAPGNLNGWQIQTTDTQTVSFVTGPAIPPLGIGSARMSVGSDGDGAAQLRNPNYSGTPLSSLTNLSYGAYVDHDGSGGQDVYLILNIDQNNDGTIDDFLFFEPVYQTAVYFPSHPQSPIILNTWQNWDALNGGWWSANGDAGANPGTGVKSLADYEAAFPNARIVNSGTSGGVRIVTGFGAPDWTNFVGNVDAFKIGVTGTNTTYDFEPFAVATNANQCKNGGFANFKRADGSSFKNQGDCIQYVNTGK